MKNAVMDVLFNLSTTVRIGWAAWLAWVVLQWGWYRHAGTTARTDPDAAHVTTDGTDSEQMLSLRPFLQSPDA